MGCRCRPTPAPTRSRICFLYMQVKNRKFVRYHPKKVNTFDCNPSYDYDMHDTFGGGAKLKGG